MIKLIWENIPKHFKKLLLPSAIVLPLISAGIYQYIIEGKLKYSDAAFNNFLLFFSIYFVTIIILSIIISYSKIIYNLQKKISQIEIKPSDSSLEKSIKLNKKKLPNKFELEVINYNFIEYTVLIWRKWLPTEVRPGIEDFLKAIEFSNGRCGKCHSDFYIDYGSYNWYQCTNSKCENDKKIIENDLYKINKKVFTEFSGNVRNDYEKYWDTYKKIYDKFTNKKYEEYANPI